MKYPIELRKSQAALAVILLFSPILSISYDRIMEGVEEEKACRVYHASAPASLRCDNSIYEGK
jgi:hypothetical protein